MLRIVNLIWIKDAAYLELCVSTETMRNIFCVRRRRYAFGATSARLCKRNRFVIKTILEKDYNDLL